MGKLLGIAIKGKKRAPMQRLERAEIGQAFGVEGDYRGKPGPRQVTVLAREGWEDACREIDVQAAWTTRRANLLVEGVALEQMVGRRLRIGGAELEITGETQPCERMEEQVPGLRKALQPAWRGGVTCTVVGEGPIATGDEVSLEVDSQ